MIAPNGSLLHDADSSGGRVPAAQQLSISIVVPVRNEARSIEPTLNGLVAQRYDPRRFEILVIDGQSTDATRERVVAFARRHPNVRLLANPGRLSSAGRNVGLRHARGEIIVVVDGHCELDDDRYLLRLAAAFQRSAADCVGRPQPLDVTGASPLQQAIAAARSSWLGHHPDSFIYRRQEGFVPAMSVAVAYRREVFEAVGSFDESFDACEDVELNYRVDRAGLRCYFTPEVAVRYRPRGTLAGLFRQLARYGRGRVRLLRKHPDTRSLRTFVPLLFVVGLLAGLALGAAVPWLRPLYFAALMTYTTIIGLSSLSIVAKKRQLAIAAWLPLVFATIHVASGAGMLLELLCPPAASTSPRRDPCNGNRAN